MLGIGALAQLALEQFSASLTPPPPPTPGGGGEFQSRYFLAVMGGMMVWAPSGGTTPPFPVGYMITEGDDPMLTEDDDYMVIE